jgi:hypothetical protein
MNMDMLAANADRERTIDVLKTGFAEGRLTQDEYSDRMTRGLGARTYGDLHKLVGDLPDSAVAPQPAHGRANGLRLRVALGALAAVLLAAVIAGLLALTSASGPATISVVPGPAAVQGGNG